MDKSGIYGIRNTVNNKWYVGSTCSTQGFKRRWTVHKSKLNNNKHYNPHLQRAWLKYGNDSFEFTILEECQDDMLIIRENAWIKYHDSINNGYNLVPAECFAIGRIVSEETKVKMGAWQKGRKKNPESVAKQRESLKQYYEKNGVDKIALEKLHKSNVGRKHKQESIEKIRNAHIGMVNYKKV